MTDTLYQRPLSARGLSVWRLVAAAGAAGAYIETLRMQAADVYSKEELRSLLASLSSTGYVQFSGPGTEGRWSITTKVPLGERAPIWLAAATHDAEEDQQNPLPPAAPPKVVMPHAPFSVFSQVAEQRAFPEKPSPTGSSTPRFALDSTGSLQLFGLELIDGTDRAVPGCEQITLSPETTRQLFRWLDRLGGTRLHNLVAAS